MINNPQTTIDIALDGIKNARPITTPEEMTKLEIGDQVSLSNKGKRCGGFRGYGDGKVVGISKHKDCVRVKWDNRKTIQIVHRMLIEKSTKNRSVYIDQVTTDFTIIKVIGDNHEKRAERLVMML